MGMCRASMPRVHSAGRGSSVRLRMALTPLLLSQSTWRFEYGRPEAARLPSLTQLKKVGLSVRLARMRR